MKQIFFAALFLQLLVFALMAPGLRADERWGIHLENNEF